MVLSSGVGIWCLNLVFCTECCVWWFCCMMLYIYNVLIWWFNMVCLVWCFVLSGVYVWCFSMVLVSAWCSSMVFLHGDLYGVCDGRSNLVF